MFRTAGWILIPLLFWGGLSSAAPQTPASAGNTFFYIEPYLKYFYTRIDGQSYTSGVSASLISQSNLSFGFHERFNFNAGWSLLANEQLSQVQFYNDPTTNVSFRQTVYSDYSLGIGNNNELAERLEYSAHLGVKEKAFFIADTLAITGIDKFFVYYGGATLFLRMYRGFNHRVGLGITADYLEGMSRPTYNVNDGIASQVFLRWEKILGNNLVHLEGGYQTTEQDTNKNTLVENNIYIQGLFSLVFP